MWHIRPEFEHFLLEDNFYDGPGSTSSATVHKGGRPVGKEKDGKGSQQKRKRDEDEDDEEDEDAQKGSKGSSGSKKEPKKFKRAFGFFVKAKRADAEARIGNPAVRIVLCLRSLPCLLFSSLLLSCLALSCSGPTRNIDINSFTLSLSAHSENRRAAAAAAEHVERAGPSDECEI